MRSVGFLRLPGRSAVVVVVSALTFVAGVVEVRADQRPGVKVTMSADTAVAGRGQLFTGEFLIQVGEAGVIGDVSVDAPGWRLVDIEPSAVGAVDLGTVVSVPFQIIAGNPDELLTLSFTHDGRRVSKSLRIGPDAAARRGRDRGALQVELGEPDQARVTAGDAITLHFAGRIVYDRPSSVDDDGNGVGPTTEEGVDGVWFEVVDEDDISDETIFTGYTNRNGFFDTGDFQWDDCDAVGCDDPDLYLRWECDTSVVNVQDATDITEPDYSWSTEAQVIEDFTGSFHDFGTLKPADAAQMPVLHIHNSIVRAHRFIRNKSGTGIELEELDVLYPDGDNAFYVRFYEEIHVSVFRQWDEAAHTHEYGHHFMENHGNHDLPDYCNGICDSDGDCSHCIWCLETNHDAWNEGWSNWLGDVITRDYPLSYTFSDGTPYTALAGLSQETIQRCQEDDTFHNPLLTEGFLGALLRDIEDDTQDERPSEVPTDEYNVIVREDCLALGPDEIFAITIGPQPTTPEQFIAIFLALYPQHTPAFYATARNIGYDELFPEDTQPPGVVQAVTSQTHPLGKGSPLPCITVDWDTPPDDVTGGYVYSIEWGTNANGVEPDESHSEVFGPCVNVTVVAPFSVGEHYVSIKARDLVGHWSNDWATFGPFTVTDCNSNGIVDVCEITCYPPTSYPELSCSFLNSFCSHQPDCGGAADCNHNAAPDGCDTADGTSEDCNENGIPDECEDMSHWGGGNGSWASAIRWVEGVIPANGNHVCIQDDDETISVTYTNGSTQVGILACDENFSVAAGVSQFAQLTLAEPSFVRGDLALTNNNSVLRVDDRLDIDGLFTWTGSNVTSSAKLAGSGTTYAHGGMRIPDGVVQLDNHDLVLGGQSVVLPGGRIDYVGASTITILPGATHEHQSTHGVIQSFGDAGAALHNQGTLIKSVSTGNSFINTFSTNSGLMHVKAGTLSLVYPSVNTGAFLADPGTILAFGSGEFEPTSSIAGERVDFLGGGVSNVRGTYDVSVITVVYGEVAFVSGADIINYGAYFYIVGGRADFNAVAGDTVQFETFYLNGRANFNSGDPIEAETMTFVGNGSVLTGPSPITVNGLLTWGEGTGFYGPGVVNVLGRLDVGAGGGGKALYSRTINNAGRTTMNGRFEMLGSAVFNNLPSGVFDILIDGIVIGSGSTTPFNNAGLVVKSAGGGTSSIWAPFNNTGTVEVRTGTLYFGDAFVQTAGETVLNGGNIATVGLPSPLPRLDGGRLRGSGTVTPGLNNVGGVVEPGLSAGAITVSGAYTQGALGRVEIELGGLTPVVEHDRLIVTGTATLLGNIDVSLINGFVPSVGDTVDVVTFASRIGGAPIVHIDDLPSAMEMLVHFLPTSVQLEFAARAASADCNGDAQIDNTDYAAIQDCLSGPALSVDPPSIATQCRCADMDLDDDVDLQDIALFQRAFGP